ncbi:hypothetical protein [Microvirga sp. Mcv34]|uniref:hypothetical protein n=1 Tax=Microvirga sp. Mcv34 TaxID=2926016 RepID=UPI0021C9C794|nr:hypothetical protein [Microvirga sp. Mcv34]
MNQVFLGLDVNGLSDRAIEVEWQLAHITSERRLHRPEVIELVGSKPRYVTGEAASLHPAGRGWVQPQWGETATRHQISDILAALREHDEFRARAILVEHLRSLVRGSDQAGFAIPDDISAEAQTTLLEAVRQSVRFSPQHGWRGWTALPVWRSVAALFGWVRGQQADYLQNLNGAEALVLSLLPDRMVAAPLTLDLASDAHGGPLLTPVRSKPGWAVEAETYPPEDIEREIVEQIPDSLLRRQLELVGAGADYVRGDVPQILLQSRDGRWLAPPKVYVHHDSRRSHLEVFRELVAEAITGRFALILIESPEEERGFPDRKWVDFAAEVAQLWRKTALVAVAPPGAVARGCAEYSARLAHNLPTFFDYLPRIEIVAQEGEDARFIPLFPEQQRVPGNQAFREQLDGKFEVPAGVQSLTFHLYKDEDRKQEDVRKAVMQLPQAPERAVPISLRVDQRPVSGHALIEILPHPEDALGPERIALDWRSMEETGLSRKDTIAKIERERPRGYPDHAPTQTHWAVWDGLEVARAMERFLPISPTHTLYPTRLDELRTALGQRLNPASRGYDPSVKEALSPFNSDGGYPSIPGRSVLVAKVQEKISYDLSQLKPGPRNNQFRQWLCLAGSWMFASAPSGVLEHLRLVMQGQVAAGHLTQAIGRAAASPRDIELAFGFLSRRLDERSQAIPKWHGAMNDLKAAAFILRFRREAGRLLTTDQATLIASAAIGVMVNELRAGAAPPLQQKFLWAALAFLLVLRHRERNQSFLVPPTDGELGSQLYVLAKRVLSKAQEEIESGRPCHFLVPSGLENAGLFLERRGGDAGIIAVISQGLDGDD